jgi:uncharacterized protein involved in exopolysaccharide biosynthesis
MLWQGAKKFIRDFFILGEDKDTGLLTVAIEWTDPEKAAYWANRLVSLANENARQRDIEYAEKSIAYLQEQIEETNVVELERVLYNLVETEQKKLMLASARDDYVFQIVDPAVIPINPARPNTIFLIFLGTVAGGFLGVVLVFARQIAKNVSRREAT